jgi:selenocysteine lyase/cysteine desulfurase
MLDTFEVRKAFPHLADNVYLNTASVGLSWVGQGAAAADFYNCKIAGVGANSVWAAKVDATRGQLGRLTGVGSECIHFAGSTTEALNLIALALPLTHGDCVVVAEDEFTSVMQPWITRQRNGVRLIRVHIREESERTKALCEAVNSRTRVLAVSHVHWRTGTRVDLDALSAVCRRYDCRLIVDGVQAVGAVPVDASLADAYCASVFKWLLSGFGLAFFVVSGRVSKELAPVLRGYSNPPPSRSLRYGHLNYPGIYALHGSLQYLESLGWLGIFRQVHRLASHVHSSLLSRGFDVVTPAESHAGIVSIRHPAASSLVGSLASHSICVQDGAPFLRVSPHFYNTEQDVDRFISALLRSA